MINSAAAFATAARIVKTKMLPGTRITPFENGSQFGDTTVPTFMFWTANRGVNSTLATAVFSRIQYIRDGRPSTLISLTMLVCGAAGT